MLATHKNKTLTTFLASLLGGVGAHRFYLHGFKDAFGWLHVALAALSLLLLTALPEQQPMFMSMPLALSVLSGFLEALVLGLTPDDKWDARYNANTGKHSESHWILALILVLTVGVGAFALIATIARCFDLFFTGGAFG
ncbi:NINE protein [Herbaspirillum sp. RTI4]|uniref:NINE protein n=1 Tax=Herbaspirillum sp. RTI4 TaxID=3048640 RepID=UPI002AB5C075|nr:NINE protein [Herbaspirillum sp. RTI4]MDY7579837.1 NINE protein [Herbaspirillum sp. RTI4]MEA9981924.1 NINE protein [Herbaspirillum sp. RTI4]